MEIPLDRDKGVPLARQIQTHLERLIGDGLLGPGVKLPATRVKASAVWPPPVATSSARRGASARPQATSVSRSSPAA